MGNNKGEKRLLKSNTAPSTTDGKAAILRSCEACNHARLPLKWGHDSLKQSNPRSIQQIDFTFGAQYSLCRQKLGRLGRILGCAAQRWRLPLVDTARPCCSSVLEAELSTPDWVSASPNTIIVIMNLPTRLGNNN